MPNPRKLSHSRGTSWEITYRVDGQMARRRFPTRAQAVDELAKARVDVARGQGLLPVDAKISVADDTERRLAGGDSLGQPGRALGGRAPVRVPTDVRVTGNCAHPSEPTGGHRRPSADHSCPNRHRPG